MTRIQIYDTTLRDGTQGEGVSLSVQDKLLISRMLDELGVDSLGVGLLLFDVEDEFQIKFERDPGPLQTLADVVRYIDQVSSEQQLAAQLATAAKVNT